MYIKVAQFILHDGNVSAWYYLHLKLWYINISSSYVCSKKKLCAIYGKWTECLYTVDPATFDAHKKTEKKNPDEKKGNKQVPRLTAFKGAFVLSPLVSRVYGTGLVDLFVFDDPPTPSYLFNISPGKLLRLQPIVFVLHFRTNKLS